jgi:hypothetical protein
MLNDLLRTTEMEVLTVRPGLYRTNSVVTGLPPIRAASKPGNTGEPQDLT